jgi:hypothetical protein
MFNVTVFGGNEEISYIFRQAGMSGLCGADDVPIFNVTDLVRRCSHLLMFNVTGFGGNPKTEESFYRYNQGTRSLI